MASSMTTTAGGVKVVTHIIPLEENTESPDLKGNSAEPKKPKLPPTSRIFLKGKPMELGVVQVFIGFIMMSLCTITLLIKTLQAEFIVLLGLPFVVSGIVAIAAHRNCHINLIKATLSVSVFCVLLAAAGIGYFSWELTFRPPNDECLDTSDSWSCVYMRRRFYNMMDGMRGLLLVLSCLELCVCIALSVFSIRAIRQDETDVGMYDSDCSLLKDGVNQTPEGLHF